MSVEDLIKNHNKVELLEMCEAEKVDCKKYWSKLQLAEAIFNAKKKASKASKASKKVSKASKTEKSDKVGTPSCNISDNECNKSAKYKKADIVALAKKCGVDTTGTRAEICARITAKITGAKPSEPSEQVEPSEPSEPSSPKKVMKEVGREGKRVVKSVTSPRAVATSSSSAPCVL